VVVYEDKHGSRRNNMPISNNKVVGFSAQNLRFSDTGRELHSDGKISYYGGVNSRLRRAFNCLGRIFCGCVNGGGRTITQNNIAVWAEQHHACFVNDKLNSNEVVELYIENAGFTNFDNKPAFDDICKLILMDIKFIRETHGRYLDSGILDQLSELEIKIISCLISNVLTKDCLDQHAIEFKKYPNFASTGCIVMDDRVTQTHEGLTDAQPLFLENGEFHKERHLRNNSRDADADAAKITYISDRLKGDVFTEDQKKLFHSVHSMLWVVLAGKDSIASIHFQAELSFSDNEQLKQLQQYLIAIKDDLLANEQFLISIFTLVCEHKFNDMSQVQKDQVKELFLKGTTDYVW